MDLRSWANLLVKQRRMWEICLQMPRMNRKRVVWCQKKSLSIMLFLFSFILFISNNVPSFRYRWWEWPSCHHLWWNWCNLQGNSPFTSSYLSFPGTFNYELYCCQYRLLTAEYFSLLRLVTGGASDNVANIVSTSAFATWNIICLSKLCVLPVTWMLRTHG
jgi:hypothetical protein